MLSICRIGLVAITMGVLSLAAADQVSTPPTIPVLRDQALADRDKNYDPEFKAVRALGGGPGYHTRTKSTQKVHSTFKSAEDAQLEPVPFSQTPAISVLAIHLHL